MSKHTINASKGLSCKTPKAKGLINNPNIKCPFLSFGNLSIKFGFLFILYAGQVPHTGLLIVVNNEPTAKLVGSVAMFVTHQSVKS